MLVEAAWAAAKAPGRLRAFFLRTRARRGHQITAVAIARKLAVLCWHMLTKNADYQWARHIPPVWTALPGRAGMTDASMFA
jgi:transposase